MARSPLTLAALAVVAAPGFSPVSTRALTTDQFGDFDSAVATDATGASIIIRIPSNKKAESDLSAQISVLEAMTPGVRSLLPFQVPEILGRATMDHTFGVVCSFIPGRVLVAKDFVNNPGLAFVIGRAIAHIHRLPTGFVEKSGIRVLSSVDAQVQTRDLLSRAKKTGLLPAVLSARWSAAVDDSRLWMFEPTFVHGSLGIDRFVIDDDDVRGVLAWGSARVGDPAWDLHWLITLDPSAQREAFAAYSDIRLSTTDPRVWQRAVLYSELELARWLMHGVDSQQQEIVDDAITMLDQLVDTIRDEPVSSVGGDAPAVMSVTDVQALLDDVAVRPETQDDR